MKEIEFIELVLKNGDVIKLDRNSILKYDINLRKTMNLFTKFVGCTYFRIDFKLNSNIEFCGEKIEDKEDITNILNMCNIYLVNIKNINEETQSIKIPFYLSEDKNINEKIYFNDEICTLSFRRPNKNI
ncbi:hypothetical protein KQI61_05820 [Anaerocolumna aminovalerica]|uniref:hypothetical protein n=1 Tax=Anaerocolumna aminovalerica TaxID=1527 RepID=UPI001C0F0C2B|nr:hypothetical protein [Anaerocolumna aminovalerica]MBU5331707.1 hypothetical protein [Anaerocolumna aminovalerica]